MYKKYSIISSLFLLCIPFLSFAQTDCEYRLELYDTFGDGWSGGFLTLKINDKSETYGLEGPSISYPISVTEGDALEISFTPGLYTYENSYCLYAPEGAELFCSGLSPRIGIAFDTIVSCPACPKLRQEDVNIEGIRHHQALIRWASIDSNSKYFLKIGSEGSAVETLSTIEINGANEYLADNLDENTNYDVYLQAICSNGDTTNQLGPITFETLWAKDVGVEAVLAPISDCNLSSEGTITIKLKNFGGVPQSLVPFNFSVNGVAGVVNQPNDGLFTGILSFDSTYTVSFDATFDFSDPISYEIKAWTEHEGDQNSSNDTTTTTIISTPLISQFPYSTSFENGAGGWMPDPNSVLTSLELGVPTNLGINTANSGQNAWVTNLDGSYNNQELSMLLSPCLDFSSLDIDPELSFALWVATESTFDGAWVETSVDGGAWTKLGSSGDTGAFWYNTIDNIYSDWWTGENLFGGWRKVSYPLAGFAGKSDVRIRIVFKSDEAVVREGIGIDDIFIAPPLTNNLMALKIETGVEAECGDAETQVTLNFRNDGAAPHKDFPIAYQINDGPVITENYGEQVLPGKRASYTFTTTFNSTEPAAYQVRAWTSLFGESFLSNDTAIYVLSTAGPGVPFFENFENGELPESWTLEEGLQVENSHNSSSYVLFDNLYDNDRLFLAETPLLGPLLDSDTLYFSYRFINFMNLGLEPTVLSNQDSLIIEISEDCGVSFEPLLVIDANNHEVRNTLKRINIPIPGYEGQWVKIRFRVVWGFGDYYFDLDNVNIRRCAQTLNLRASVSAPRDGKDNGIIRIEPQSGFGPYAYVWDNGGRQASQGGLAPGTYEITVTDQQGCIDAATITLESVVDAKDPISKFQSIKLAPNPNNGQSTLNLEFDDPHEVHISIFDAQGRLLQQTQHQRLSQLSYPIDLSDQANGIYFVRVLVENEVKTIRMLKLSL